MKVAVSYISSNYNLKETINKINISDADYIHMDIMDGKYVTNKNFMSKDIKWIIKNATKNIDVHLMVKNPIKYMKYFKKKKTIKNLFFHVNAEKKPIKLIDKLKKYNISPGLVINPEEDISDYNSFYHIVDRVLIMSVVPGAGGQNFIEDTIPKIKKLADYKLNNNLSFEIAVDGGINNNTIKSLNNLNIDYVISGSYICKSENYDEQINSLK